MHYINTIVAILMSITCDNTKIYTMAALIIFINI